jgi:hypothetical protein
MAYPGCQVWEVAHREQSITLTHGGLGAWIRGHRLPDTLGMAVALVLRLAGGIWKRPNLGDPWLLPRTSR